ncbi:3-phosphoglycerate dehydrogenase [bacterium]|nr:D-2-hydroxyacid dehydrogenase [bacterium]RKZ33106.1 MAG: 3-phosphoglycerate dehydrogenase [bacterium]
MAKILVCDKISPTAIERMKALGHEVVVKTGMTPEELIETVPPFEAMIVRSATKVRVPVIDAAKNLKVIIRGGVGIDNIDVDYARSKGIEVRNTPAASSPSVAELALGHMFSVYRFIAASTWRMRQGEDFKKIKKESQGRELAGKTLGIIGIGRIGKELAKRALALGMKVIAYDAYVTDPGIEGVTMVSFDELLSQADIISLHVPKTDKPIIGREEFAKMKDGAVIINTARGGVVDEDALLEALDSGKLYGAAIDVFVGEPNPKPELVNHPKVSVTPHLGASTNEAQERIGEEIIKILNEVFGS